ncbi:hypothetical protein [Mycobacterium intracellulare]|uniref:hypothetical protein n=1 Tax=Mycobacterium intracellulare TaxID=1767 RepID=UPI00259893A7|nr:hypothetical protein [Mycobacterium intracellulare]MDM3894732.1 hypothetical protein [Mycobacterium intracellulare]
MIKPEVFTFTFWQTTAARAAHYSATFALSAWGLGAIGSADASSHLSIPSWGVAIGAGLGALYAVLLAVVGAQIPAAAASAAALFPKPGQEVQVQVVERPDAPQADTTGRADPGPAPTAADLKAKPRRRPAAPTKPNAAE